jgi:L-fuconolactonase
MRLDAHQHFWQYDPGQYPWIQADWPIRRDYLPSDLRPLLQQNGLDGSIAVQARQTLEESRWLLQLAAQHPAIVGVVGWVDLRSDAVLSQLAEFAQHPKFVGVRHVVQDEPDDNFVLTPAFVRGLRALAQFGLSYDLLVYPRQLPAAIKLVRQLPGQTFLLDHLAKPPIRDGALSPWREQIRELGREPNVWCKVSGLVTEARWTGWKPNDFAPYLDVVFEAFGTDRLLFGSDWPVCLLAASYADVYGMIDRYAAQVAVNERAKLFGLNAARAYRTGPDRSGA